MRWHKRPVTRRKDGEVRRVSLGDDRACVWCHPSDRVVRGIKRCIEATGCGGHLGCENNALALESRLEHFKLLTFHRRLRTRLKLGHGRLKATELLHGLGQGLARFAELNHARLQVAQRTFHKAVPLLVVGQEIVPQGVLRGQDVSSALRSSHLAELRLTLLKTFGLPRMTVPYLLLVSATLSRRGSFKKPMP